MSPSTQPDTFRRISLYGLVALFVLLHNDLWWWDDPTFVFGLPIALTYHLLYCLAAMGLMALLIRFAWPRVLDHDPDDETAVETSGRGGGAA